MAVVDNVAMAITGYQQHMKSHFLQWGQTKCYPQLFQVNPSDHAFH